MNNKNHKILLLILTFILCINLVFSAKVTIQVREIYIENNKYEYNNLEGVLVEISGESYFTNSKGKTEEILTLVPGKYDIKISKDGFSTLENEIEVSDATQTSGYSIMKITDCVEDWSCVDWSSCNNGKQTRTCSDSNKCGSTEEKPEFEQSCEIEEACVESWTCGAWDTCIEGEQTRNCNDLNECGTFNDILDDVQSCEIESVCYENWYCENWSICSNEEQSRTCDDFNNCGTNIDKPKEKQSCIEEKICEENWTCEDWSICSNEEQSRTCSDINNCNTKNDMPEEKQSCIEEKKCEENWTCEDWSICSNEEQSRTCSDLNNCNTKNDMPEEKQSCIEEKKCEENWTCEDWNICSNEEQSRTCSDLNNCNTKNDIPEEKQSCIEQKIIINDNYNFKIEDKDYRIKKLVLKDMNISTKLPISSELESVFVETKLGKKKINVIDIENKVKQQDFNEIKLISIEEGSDDEPVYVVNGNKKAKVLFFIPVEFEVSIKLNTIDGKIIEEDKPWWSFLIF